MKCSENIKNLAQALAKAQSEIGNPTNTATAKVPTKSGSSYSYSYTPLPDILDHVKPTLAKHGLSVLQSGITAEQGIGVQTILLHESGEWVELPPVLAPVNGSTTPQDIGGILTYFRRYQMAGIAGIASDDDDDASGASRKDANIRPKDRPTKSEPASDTKATKAQHGKIHALAKDLELEHEAVSKGAKMVYKVESMSDLTREQASDMIERMERKLAEKRTEEQQEFGKEMAGKK